MRLGAIGCDWRANLCDRVAILVKGKIALMESVGAIDKNNFERQYFDIVANTI